MAKLSIDNKINIYNLWKHEHLPIPYIAKKYSLNRSTLGYLIILIDMHGIAVLSRQKQFYSIEFKQKLIREALLKTESINQISLKYALPSNGLLYNWLRSYYENGYTIVTKKRGRKPHVRQNNRGTKETSSSTQKRKPCLTRKELKVAHSKRIRKKIRCLSGRTNRTRKAGQAEEVTKAVTQLRRELNVSLTFILDVINSSTDLPHLSRSDYYYTLKKVDKDDKNKGLMERIRHLFEEHHSRYGYRRITLQLKREGIIVNHKKVKRLMTIMGLHALHNRKSNRYSSYQGTIGKIKENQIKTDFHALKPDQKWYADITEFNLRGEKTYLSALLDGCTQEIIAHSVSKHPNLEHTMVMMKKAALTHSGTKNLTFHTDQGWQYQHGLFQKWLSDHGMKQSMSRKGKSTDNGLIESFFGTLKREMFHGFQRDFDNISELNQAISNYINYYNTKRIKSKLKGRTPMEHRAFVLKQAQ